MGTNADMVNVIVVWVITRTTILYLLVPIVAVSIIKKHNIAFDKVSTVRDFLVCWPSFFRHSGGSSRKYYICHICENVLCEARTVECSWVYLLCTISIV